MIVDPTLYLDARMRPALVAAEMLWENLGKTLLVREARGHNGEVSAAHPGLYGLAVTLDSQCFKPVDQVRLVEQLREALGHSFEVHDYRNRIELHYVRKGSG